MELPWGKNLEVQCGIRDRAACVVTCFLGGAWIGQNLDLHPYQPYTVDSPVGLWLWFKPVGPETLFKYTYPPCA